jgi:UDP-N-acetylmuramoylalanine--D-glutamate ligase
MKIALLGYGKEGQAAEKYFGSTAEITIFQDFTREEIEKKDFSDFDLVLRSPSVPPLHLENESSLTRYFFDHCPCPIIGVTATKGKGTICSLTKAILDALGEKVYLVGNIGVPSIDVLDELTPTDVVIYEMSSFQLWDMTKSPHIAVVGTIEPDHLNVHKDYDDYLNAKANICRHQTENDYLVYYNKNADSLKIVSNSSLNDPSHKIEYPFYIPEDIKESVAIPGDHNIENAMAAIAAAASYKNLTPEKFIAQNEDAIRAGLSSFHGLPHHLEFVRTLNNVDYYDDSFSASSPSLDVAMKAFPNRKVVLIAGGKDRGLDLTPHKNAIFKAPNLYKAILIGETKEALAKGEDENKFIIKDDYKDAILTAKALAESLNEHAVVLLSPGAASFDMFKDFYDRGEQFKKIVEEF